MADSQAEGGINANLDFKTGPQALPTEGPENVFPFDLGGFDTSTGGDEMSADDERPNPPDPDQPGLIPDPGGGDPGQTMNLASVAPYTYGEFPKDKQKQTGYAGALRGHKVVD